MGSLACLLELESTAPPPTSLAAYAQARLAADALAGRLDPAPLAPPPTPLMALATANVVLGIWRGRLVR